MIPAPLYYVSPGQVDFQIPYEVSPGPALVQVTSNGVASISAGVTVQQAAPSILTWTDDAGKTRALTQNPITRSTPAVTVPRREVT